MIMKPKVLLLHNILSPHIEPVFRALSFKVDLEVFYCAEREANRTWKVTPKEYKYKILESKRVEFAGKDLFTLFYNPDIWQELDDAKPEIVILSGWDLPTYWITALYCLKMRIPYVVWSGSTIHEKSWRRTITLPLVKLILKGASGYISYGLRARDYLLRLGASVEKIRIAYNGFDYDYYSNYKLPLARRREIQQRYQLDGKKVILFYGQLIERKDPLTLLRSFHTLKNNDRLALMIIGDGDQKDVLNDYVQKYSLKNVHIIKNLGDDSIRDIYALSDIFVLPSTEEVWGLVVNQAMAMSVPPIVSNKVGCLPDLIVEGKTGLSFTSGDVDDLSSKLSLLLDNKSLREEIGKQARQQASLARADLVAERVFQSLLDVQSTKADSDLSFEYCSLPTIEDGCKLTIAEEPIIPFPIKRIYYIYNALKGYPRGFHAHKKNRQVFFCLAGTVTLVLDDGKHKTSIHMNDPKKGVVLEPMIWHEMHDITKDTIMMVMASEKYDPEDYVRDYSVFLSMKDGKRNQ